MMALLVTVNVLFWLGTIFILALLHERCERNGRLLKETVDGIFELLNPDPLGKNEVRLTFKRPKEKK